MDSLPTNHFITELQFTKHLYKDVYPAIDPTKPEMSVAGRVVIVTGASRGIGAKGIVPAFARAGARGIVLVATSAEALEANAKAIKQINPSVETLAVATNITDVESVNKLFAAVKAKFGHADILVNSAGVAAGGGNIHEEHPSTWWSNFEVNGKGAFLLAQQFIKSLPSPTSTPATIINLASSGAWQVFPTISGYCISKTVALQLTAFIAAGYPNNTTVGLHPGMLDTDMLMEAFSRFDLNSPELVGGLCVWLSGERARFLSGRLIAANWSVDDLVARKSEIEAKNLLKMDLTGKFGAEQFQ